MDHCMLRLKQAGLLVFIKRASSFVAHSGSMIDYSEIDWGFKRTPLTGGGGGGGASPPRFSRGQSVVASYYMPRNAIT